MSPADERFEDGINGRYDFGVRAVLGEAWERTSGVKRIYVVAGVLWILVVALLAFASGPANDGLSVLLYRLVSALVFAPFVGGFTMLGARRAADLPISVNTLFAYTSKTLPIAVIGVLLAVVYWGIEYLFATLTLSPLFAEGLAFLVFMVVYIFTAMTSYLIADRDMGPFAALTASVRAVGHKWLKLAGLLLATFAIMFVSVLPLGIGLIWTYPMIGIAYGIVYREMFGVQEAMSE